jgi:hypothetical protein
MSDEREQILSAVDYWRLHANDIKAEGGFAHMPVTDLRAILGHIDTLRTQLAAARAVIEAALVWLNATGAEASARADAKLASATYDYRAALTEATP